MTGLQDDVPVAVIGFSVNFPLEATSSAAFWKMLVEGRSARTVVPPERFNINGYYHPDKSRRETVPFKEGHFLAQDLASFDAPFFSVIPAEAAAMDPQQRCLLETSYRAFENAGIPIENATGSNTSVYIGSTCHDWDHLLKHDGTKAVDYEATGAEFSFLANRLSWYYGLRGPSLSLDTACSSSMTALHLACQGLKNGEAQMALVGGANIIMDPRVMVGMSNMGMLSPDGICYTFDERANGYARGEGIGVVIVKLLDQALKDHDTIRGIIRATGSNQDGKTPSMTQPDEKAQEELIRNTYEHAGLDRKLTRYFEAHGTGTQAGDPKEAQAIAAAFMDQRPLGEPLYIGAVKTNIGHLEGASGIAGLIKTILVLENGMIPRNLWFRNANPAICTKEWNIEFPVKNIPWPSNELRRASINSFGFGGTNVHVILDDAYNYLRLHGLTGNHCTSCLPPSNSELCNTTNNAARNLGATSEHRLKRPPKLFVFSAGDEATLENLLPLFVTHISTLGAQTGSEDYLSNLAYTLYARRSALRWRSYTISDSLPQLSKALAAGLESFRSTNTRRVGLIFTGQGAQWHAMGRDLTSFPAFYQSLQKSQQALRDLGCDWSLLDEIWKEEEYTNIHKPEYSQPACTALQIALVDLLRQWALSPSRVIGHSSGEIAAAYCAGLLTQETAMKIAFYRGMLAARLNGPNRRLGAMLAVALPEMDIEPHLKELKYSLGSIDVEVACINSPKNLTMSGNEEHIDALQVILNRNGMVSKKLRVGIAYHSKAMNELADDYRTLIGKITLIHPAENACLMFSTVTRTLVSSDEICRAEYWVQNMISPVCFSESLVNLCSTHHPSSSSGQSSLVTDLLEVGPHSALAGPVQDVLSMCMPSRNISYSSVLVRDVSAVDSSLSAMGRLYSFGCPIDLTAVNQCSDTGDHLQALASLPEYPFNHTGKYWTNARMFENYRFRTQANHELLGAHVSDWNPLQPRWRHFLQLRETPWIKDHKVNGIELYPAAGMLVMAIEAARQLDKGNHCISGYTLDDVKFMKPLRSVSGAKDFEIQVCLRHLQSNDDSPSGTKEFSVFTVDSGHWTENCRGNITIDYDAGMNEVDNGREARKESEHLRETYQTAYANCTRTIDPKIFYEDLETIGIEYGPTFQVLEHINHGKYDAVARVRLGKWAMSLTETHHQEHVVHPSELDGILQLSFAALQGNSDRQIPTLVPDGLQYMWISSRGLRNSQDTSPWAHAKVETRNSRGAELSLMALASDTNELRVKIRGFKTTNLQSPDNWKVSREAEPRRLCFFFDWRPDLRLLGRQELLTYCKTASSIKFPDKSITSDIEYICYTSIMNTLEHLDHELLAHIDRPHLSKYADWMKLQAQKYDQGKLIHWRPDWVTLKEDDSYNECVFARVQNSSATGRLYVEIAKNASKVLEGRVDALELLFGGNLAAEYYHEMAGFQLAPLQPFVDCLAHQNPGMKILEIGAGTGGSTLPLLSMLQPREMRSPRFEHYTFTDISAGFFGKAKEIFSTHTNRMTFSPLNIELDPLRQGFAEGTYDLVLAANVLHATPSLDETLRNVRKLVKPGGHLILCELYSDVLASVGFVFGLLPGWWLSTENGRASGPLLSEDSWQEIVCRNGFSGPDLLFHDHEDLGYRLGHAMVFTAIDMSPAPPEIPEVVFITAPGSVVQNTVARQTGSRLEAIYEVIDIHKISPQFAEQKFCVLMLEMEENFLQDISDEGFARLQSIVSSARGLLWVRLGGRFMADKPEVDLVLGLSRCVRSENEGFRFVTLGLQNTANPETIIRHITNIIRTTFLTPPEESEAEYEENAGILYINRLVEANEMNDYLHSQTEEPLPMKQTVSSADSVLKLDLGVPGSLDSMRYISALEAGMPLAQDEVEIKVEAVGVNFKDILIALGRVPEAELGGECAGTVTRTGSETDLVIGDRVCLVTIGTYRTCVRVKAATVLRIPDTMSFVEGATLPIIYSTAYHALFDIARLQEGESVLIHSAAGGTGQAAIQLARLLKAEVFVTVGSKKKKKLLMDLYNIPKTHIFSSRGPTFAKGIGRLTHGKGIDVVLNSLSGKTLLLSWGCLAPFGRFVEIGRRDILQGNQLPMLPFDRNRSFVAINMEHMLQERPVLIRRMMKTILDLAREKKIAPPYPLHIYQASQVEDAFRYLQGGTNTGKTVLEFKEDDQILVLPSSHARPIFDSRKSYMIVGGLGGLGQRIAQWMIDLGATNLILVSRSGTSSEKTKTFVQEMQTKGINMTTPLCDISDENSLASIIMECANTMPPIKGCIQAAMVLQDSLFESMPLKVFRKAIRPKVDGSWNLHRLLPRKLDFFILLSSTSGVIGYPCQANYASGNTYQDALARYRISHGEKAVSLDLGVLASSGYVAERPELQAQLERLGLPPIYEEELLHLLEYYCNPRLEMLCSLKAQVITGVVTPAHLKAKNIEVPYWLRQCQFRAIHQMDDHLSAVSVVATNPEKGSLLVAMAASLEEAALIASTCITEKMSRILCMSIDNIDTNQPPHRFGVDSLVAVELKNWFMSELGVDMKVFEILGNETITDIGLAIARKVRKDE